MNKLISLCLFTSLFYTSSVFAQNSYKFIEPNISIAYDSNQFKISKRYSNTTYETESYDFLYTGDPGKKATIHIRAAYPAGLPSKQTQDSLILASLEEIRDIDNDTFAIVELDKKPRNINGFSCAGAVGYDKMRKEHSVFIGCHYSSNNNNTEINLISDGNNLESGYVILQSFLKSFKSYSRAEIDKEDELIKNKYTVVVTPTQDIVNNFQYMPKTYVGIVSTKQPLQHTISEVRMESSFGLEVFTPAENGKLYIRAVDGEKGEIKKEGELILLNSFGKKVKIPFSFSYLNKGQL